MKISKGKLFITSLFIILVSINIFFYSKYKIEKEKNNFIEQITSRLSISSSDYYEPLLDYANFKDNINWQEIMGEIDSKRTSSAAISNYIAIKYSNGNTLMIENVLGNRGDYKIQNMFFLNDNTVKNLKFYSQGSNE